MTKFGAFVLVLSYIALGMMWERPELFTDSLRYAFTISTIAITSKYVYRAYKAHKKKGAR